MAELEAFRAEVRAWLADNCPKEMREPFASEDDRCWGGRKWTFSSPAQKAWMEAMAAKGWTTPEWPTEYGGGGLSREEGKDLILMCYMSHDFREGLDAFLNKRQPKWTGE